MWLGLLYAVLSIGARFLSGTQIQGQDSGAQNQILQTARMDFYREKVVQALILANYTKCPPYTVEACLLYFGSEYTRSSDTQFSMWILVGMIVRVALRSGYHRDPSHFTNISPFRAELRRRTWLVILSIDLVSSSQVGLPRMIQSFMYDTKEPRNVAEDEIFEEMTELPPSRETQLGPLSYLIVMTRVRTTHAKILDLTNTTSHPAYRDIMNLDAVLRQVYDRLPEPSKPSFASSDFDFAVSPESMRRIYLGLSFLKAELVLHRPYLLLGRTDSGYEYSRRVCINAASEMLQLQQKIDAEIMPGGRLWSPGWKVFTMSWYMSSIVAQDFLLATTVLILDLDRDLTSPLPRPTSNSGQSGLQLDRAPPSREQIIGLLLSAQLIWHKASKRSNEARKVAEATRLVLQKANIGGVRKEDVPQRECKITPRSADADSKPAAYTSITPSDSTTPSSFDLNDFAMEASNPSFFTANGNDYTYPFSFNDVPMDLDDFTNALNWNPFSSYPNGHVPQQPPFQ